MDRGCMRGQGAEACDCDGGAWDGFAAARVHAQSQDGTNAFGIESFASGSGCLSKRKV